MRVSDLPDDKEWVIQLLVDNKQNATLLREWLDPEWTVVEEQHDEVDMVIVDKSSLEANAEAIETLKTQERPQFLPVVVLVPTQRGSSPSRAIDSYRHITDDIVEIPVEKWELRKTIESQIRTRLFSLELRNREEQYRDLVELLPEGIVIVQDGTIAYLNEVGRELLTGDAGNWSGIEGERIQSYVAPDCRDAMSELLAAVEETGLYDEVVELDIESRTGQRHSCEVSGVRVTYQDAPATQLIVRDVTERKRQQRQIELFRRALDDTDQGVTIADASQEDEPLVYANAAFERITGYQTSETIGRNCRFLQGEDTDPETVRQMRDAVAEERAISVEVKNYRKDGTPFWNEVTITPVSNDDGKVTHYIGFQKDITERVEREQRLKEYEAVLQAAGDPIFAIGPERTVTNVNEAFVSFTGRDRLSLVGSPLNSIFADSDQLHRAVQTVGTNEEPMRVSATLVDQSGERRYCEVSLASGDSGDVVGVIRDMTDDRRREQRVAVFDRLLRHNLRNKMNVILGRADSISVQPSETDDHVAAILAAGEDLLDLVDDVRSIHDLLDDTTAETKGQPLSELVQRRIDGIRTSYPTVDVETDLASLAVTAHPALGLGLDQLLENAFEHNTGNRQSVRVTITEADGQAVLKISDNGPGIPKEELIVLSADAETPLEHSQGVGMWIARWTVERSGGQITVDVDDGTTVTVRLPLASQ